MAKREQKNVTRSEKNKKEHKKVENEKRNEFSNFFLRFLLIIFLIICCILIYSRYTATSGLAINEYKIINEKIPDSFNGFKIVQFSDIHYNTTVDKDVLKNIVKKINILNPDLIIFTGDIVDKDFPISDEDTKDIIECLKKLEANAGKYAVNGNEDKNINTDIIFKDSDFNLLDNNYDLVYYKGYTPIVINGLGSKLNDNLNMENSFKYLENDLYKNLFQISLVHESDAYLDIVNNYTPDVIMTGNSLGGLIRLPSIGSIYNLEGSKDFNDKYITANNTNIYNSFGLGTTKIKFRLFNRPSINVYRLYNK